MTLPDIMHNFWMHFDDVNLRQDIKLWTAPRVWLGEISTTSLFRQEVCILAQSVESLEPSLSNSGSGEIVHFSCFSGCKLATGVGCALADAVIGNLILSTLI